MSTIAPLQADEVAYPFPATRFYCESWWTCWTSPQERQTWRQPFDALLALSDDLSVMLPSIRDLRDMVVRPEPRWGRRRVPSWQGIPCRLGRAELWLPDEASALLRPFSLLVRVPKQDPQGALPYILLGSQFLREYRVRVELDAGQSTGRLLIP